MDTRCVTEPQKSVSKSGIQSCLQSQPEPDVDTNDTKAKLPTNSYPGVYKIPCPCGVPPYIGKTKLRTNTRINHHEDYVAKEQWERSGAAEQARTCPMGPSFKEAMSLTTEHRNFERLRYSANLLRKCYWNTLANCFYPQYNEGYTANSL